MSRVNTPAATQGLREAVLRAWRDSPTRLTEDTNAERDLRVGGYRDRLFVELAQNAADAAARAGSPGRVRVRLADGELRVANTGAPLDDAGVAALASLRASAKRPTGTGTGGDPDAVVGRFGVGFAAVLAVTSEPRVVSRTGGVAFSAARTRAAIGRDAAPGTTGTGPAETAPTGIAEAETADVETTEAGVTDAETPADADVPILRLPWPPADDEPAPPDGFDTEVRLPLRAGVNAADVLGRIRAEAADVLLVLPWLAEVDVEGECWTRATDGDVVKLTAPGGHRTRWLTRRGEGCVWAVPVTDDGEPLPLTEDVLHAPTPTDERLSLPARLSTSAVPVEPSRRRVLAGATTPGARRAFRRAAEAYPGLLRRVPVEHRLTLVPRARFPLSDVDSLVRELVTERLTEDAWLPGAGGGPLLPGRRARVLELDAPALLDPLADVLPGLVAAPLCGHEAARVLATVGARPVGVAELVESVTGVEREPSWWWALYEELFAAVERREVELDELGALPVPLGHGRTVPGPRDALLPVDTGVAIDPATLGAEVAGLRVVHPEAAHPLLERLGARRAGPAELLRAPALAEAVDSSVADALAGVDVLPFVEAVLRLVSEVGGEVREPALGALALPAEDGWRRADELVLPDAALLDVLDPDAVGADAPLDVLDADFAARWPPGVLTAVGVLDTFRVVDEDGGLDRDGLDRDGGAAEVEAEAVAADELPIADLDLVADDAWPRAVRLLAARPRTRRALTAPDGRVRAWLSANALLAGRAPRQWRLPSAHELAGLFDPVPDVGLAEDLLVVAGVRTGLDLTGAADADQVCARLADAGRVVAPGVVLRAYAALAALPVERVEPPERVRTLAGTVADAADVAVLDAPWLLTVWAPEHLVAVPDYADAVALAEVLDLPFASDETAVGVTSEGEFVTWHELPAIGEVADLLGVVVPDGGVVVHPELTVGERAVSWWHADGTPHASDSPDGLARAFAWAAGRWGDRTLIAALLDDPDIRVLLG